MSVKKKKKTKFLVARRNIQEMCQFVSLRKKISINRRMKLGNKKEREKEKRKEERREKKERKRSEAMITSPHQGSPLADCIHDVLVTGMEKDMSFLESFPSHS